MEGANRFSVMDGGNVLAERHGLGRGEESECMCGGCGWARWGFLFGVSEFEWMMRRGKGGLCCWITMVFLVVPYQLNSFLSRFGSGMVVFKQVNG